VILPSLFRRPVVSILVLQVGCPQIPARSVGVNMLDAHHLDADVVVFLAAGYALQYKVLQLQELLLQLEERAHILPLILWLEHELLVVVCMQVDEHAQDFYFPHNAFDSSVLQLFLQPSHQHPADGRASDRGA